MASLAEQIFCMPRGDAGLISALHEQSLIGFRGVLHRKPDSSSRLRSTVLQRIEEDKVHISFENALEQYRTVPCQ